MSAKLILIDGPDGVGKTTQIQKLNQTLLEDNNRVLVIRINGGSPIGEELRKVYLGDLERPAETDFFLGQAIFAAFVAEVAKNREQYDFILVDRSPYSNLVYQGYAGGFNIEEISVAVNKTVGQLMPDLVIFYDAPDDILLTRRSVREHVQNNYFENKPADFHAKTAEAYRKIARDIPSIMSIDASATETAVQTATLSAVLELTT